MDPTANNPSGLRGSPATALQMLQEGPKNAMGMDRGSVRGSPSRVLQMLETVSAEQKNVEMDFDPNAFFLSSRPSSQESPGDQDPQNAMNSLLPEAINANSLYSHSPNAGNQSYVSCMQMCEKARVEESTKRKNQDVNAENQSYASCMQKRKFARVGGKGDLKGALYQRERQIKYKQDSIDLEQELQQEQTSAIQSGRQTPEEVSDYLQKTEAKTMASDNGQKLVMKIQYLQNVERRNPTQRGQLHRTQKKLHTLITAEKRNALQELSAENALMLLSEAASDFCAPT